MCLFGALRFPLFLHCQLASIHNTTRNSWRFTKHQLIFISRSRKLKSNVRRSYFSSWSRPPFCLHLQPSWVTSLAQNDLANSNQQDRLQELPLTLSVSTASLTEVLHQFP